MTINSVMNTGIQGMQNSYRAIEKAADEIVKIGVADSAALNPVADVNTSGQANVVKQNVGEAPVERDLFEPIIEMKVQQHLFDASAKIVKSADEMLGTIMDIKA